MRSTMQDKCFKAATRFCSELSVQLPKHQNYLHLDEDAQHQLCYLLGDDNYTYLTLSDGKCVETVRLCVAREALYIDRGIDDTEARSWPCGTSITFEWAESAMIDLSIKANEYVPEEPECDKLFSGKVCVGRYDLVIEDGLIVSCRQNKNMLHEGCYESPVITIDEDGCVSAIAEGPTGYGYEARCAKAR